MHFSASVLVALAATASAIDIRGFGPDSCNGGYRACVGINPNVCCSFSGSSSSGLASIGVAAVSDVRASDELECAGLI